MKLKTLTITNFMSIRSASIDLSDQGLILVQGKNNDDPAFDSNGAGKSSSFEALTWVKYDKTVRGLTGDEVVNENIGKNCSVVLDFEDDAGVPFRITRYRKHNEHKNAVYIFKNGTNITPKSAKDTNKLIEEIFQMDFQTFTNSILFGQGLVKMFTVATDKEKKEILEKMLQIDLFQKCLDVAKKKVSAKKAEISELDAETKKTENLVTEVEGTISSLEKAEQEEGQNIEEEIDSLKNELSDVKKDIKKLPDTSDLEKKRETLKGLRGDVDEALKDFEEQEETKSRMLADITLQQREAKRLELELTDLKKEAEKIASGEGTSCPACGQEITEETTQQSLTHVTEKMKTVLANRKKALKKFDVLSKAYAQIDEMLLGKAPLMKQRDKLTGEISDLNASIRERENLQKQLTARKDRLEASIQRLKDKVGNTYKPLIEEKREQLSEFKRNLALFSTQREKLDGELKKLEFWVGGFGNAGLKSYLLDSVTPFLNKRANYYLSKLAGNTTQVEFSTQTRLANGELRDKFEVRILNSVGGGSYTANSTGERRRIDLSISLALQDLVMSRSNGRYNVLLYDEIFDGLDAIGCENAILLLQEMQKNVESIFVITHNDILKSYFDKFLVVTKEGGETKIHKE